MKKILVMAALATLVSTSAFAVISGTAHDLSTYSPSGESCVFCHTPHGADTTVVKAPLWNRTVANATDVYVGVSMAVPQTVTAVNQTDAPLCLSCHDGLVAETLQNEPNAGDTNATALVWASADANLTLDMSNDHPVGMSYDTSVGSENGLNTTVSVKVGVMADALKGATNDVWCSSCHDVHDDTNNPFLRMDNAGSALCTTCHIK